MREWGAIASSTYMSLWEEGDHAFLVLLTNGVVSATASTAAATFRCIVLLGRRRVRTVVALAPCWTQGGGGGCGIPKERKK